MIQDFRYALRILRRSPGFACVAILSLALGAGANTAIFQLLNAVRLRTLPVRAPEELVELRADDMTSRPLGLLLAVSGLVLLIACANLAHRMLARASARRREMAVRVAIGASGFRLARQLAIESLVIAASGIAGGLLAARWLSRLLVSFLAADGASVALDLPFDGRTFAFAALLTVVTCAVFASIPVLRAARTQPALALAAGGRSLTTGRERNGARRILLASQIALSLALLMGTLLFVRSLRSLEALDAGFQQHGIVIASVSFAGLQLAPDRAPGFRREVLQRVRALPAVDAAAEAVIMPLSGGNWNNRVWADGADSARARVAFRNMVGPGYFHALNTPILVGRDFDDHDLAPASARVAIVNEAFARDLSLGPRPVGRRFWLETTPSEPSAAYEVVGVVKNTKYRDLREDFQPVMFFPMSPAALRSSLDQIVIRSSARGTSWSPPSAPRWTRPARRRAIRSGSSTRSCDSRSCASG